MAELLGAVSAGIGIAAFAIQLASKINTLRELCAVTPDEVRAELKDLADRLELFRSHLVALEPLEHHPALNPAIQLTSQRFGIVERLLEKLQLKFPSDPENGRGNHRQRMKLIVSRQQIEDRIEKARQHVNDMSHDLER